MERTQQVRMRRTITAKLSDADSALLDRACRRLAITRTEAVQQGVRRILQRQRELEALAPLE